MRTMTAATLFACTVLICAITTAHSQSQYLRRRMQLGGYALVDPHSRDPEVAKAAIFALRTVFEDNRYQDLIGAEPNTDATRVTVAKAEQQVVAGKNYKLTLQLFDRHALTCLGAFDVTIYNRFGELSVTNWGEEHSCEEADAMKKEYRDAFKHGSKPSSSAGGNGGDA